MFMPFAIAAPKARPSFTLPQRQRALSAKRRTPFVPAPESFVIAALCLLDLSSTLWWVSYREATEGNPIMAYYLTHGGTIGFALAKMVLLIMPLIIAEWARQTKPRFVRAALRVGIAGYIGAYAIGVAHINGMEADGDGPTAYPAPTVAHAVRSNSPLHSGWNPSACGQTASFSNPLVQDEE